MTAFPTTEDGENAVFVDNVTQFRKNETEEGCVEFTFSNIWHSVQPGYPNPYTYEDIHQMAADWYVHFFGSISAQNGTSDTQLYEMFNSAHLTPEILPITFNGAENDERVRAALRAGKLVAICAAESSFFDLEIGRPPYSWDTKPFNHCIVATGLITSGPWAGNVWVRDTAAVSGGYAPSTKRPYDIGKMQYVSLTAVTPGWLTGSGGITMSGLPTGAKDNGKDTITFSNGHVMVKGFRAKYLEMAAKGLIPDDDLAMENEHGSDPVEQSNPAFWGGAGSSQLTRYFRLGYSVKAGVSMTYIGQELAWYVKALATLKATPPPVILPPVPAGLSDEQKKAVAQLENSFVSIEQALKVLGG